MVPGTESQIAIPGQRNSSITRVRPFFQALLRRDATGKDWLPKLLSLSSAVPSSFASNPGVLLPWVSETRVYKDRVLKKEPYNVASIMLEKCFEYSLRPPRAFLHWLIENIPCDKWEAKRSPKMSPATLEWRDKLFGLGGEELRQEAMRAALDALEKRGSQGSAKQWWAFEGFTEVDCYLETDRLILLIEGKRTEPLSESTDWYEGRNQLLRNLEAIGETAGGKEFGVMVLSEKLVATPSESVIQASFPHLKSEPHKVASLMKHFWGCFTWETACQATGLDCYRLPDTTSAVVNTMGSGV